MTAPADVAAPTWTRRHLLGLADLSREEIECVLDTAAGFQEVSTRSIKKVPALRGRVVVNLFFEDSTRTRTSFGLAAKRLSADTLEFSAKGSSTSKGESLADTARNIEAMGVDIVVCRHPAPGAPHFLSRVLKVGVVNAGDGAHEHPTQALLDLFTIRERRGTLEGLKVLFVGDITHSRVARSNIFGLRTLGAGVGVCGPATLIPPRLHELGVTIHHDLDEALPQYDVVNLLRIQLERQRQNLFPSVREYARLYGITAERLRRARPDVLVMHPGPVNRGVEITPEVADGAHSVILRQVTNGLAVRMAVLYLVATAPGSRPEASE